MSRITDKQLVELINRRNLPPADPRFIGREAMSYLLEGRFDIIATRQAKTQAKVTVPPVLRWRPLNATAIEVNLDALPILPFAYAELDWTAPGQTGWVKLELKDGELFVADREVVVHLTDSQKIEMQKGRSVNQFIKDRSLHPNIMDALFENQHLIPPSWKQNLYQETPFVCFWAKGCRGSDSGQYIRRLIWCGSQWHRDYDWIVSSCGCQS